MKPNYIFQVVQTLFEIAFAFEIANEKEKVHIYVCIISYVLRNVKSFTLIIQIRFRNYIFPYSRY